MKEIEHCFFKVKDDYLKFLANEKILNQSKEIKINNLKNNYIPISFWIEKKYKKKGKPLFLGLSGGQGSGKTTTAKILKIILKKFFKRKIFIISIDDFYKTKKNRIIMSKKIHSLLKIRGVPGTHDINIIKEFFNYTKNKIFKNIKLPKFDKSTDDRLNKKYWINIKKKPEIVILEGWCVGAKSQKKSLIKKSINTLEKYEDPNCVWRKYVNKKLRNEYKKVFAMIDNYIFMKVPSFQMAFKWRVLQEKKLRKKSHLIKKIMSYGEIKRFVMFYERITLQMIKDLSKSSSVVILLKKNHDIKKTIFRH